MYLSTILFTNVHYFGINIGKVLEKSIPESNGMLILGSAENSDQYRL